MTPAARVQAAVEVLDRVLGGGEAAERALTGWARRSRFAGSGDRAAVRDHVFDALRRLRSSAWLGGLGDVTPDAMDGRSVMAGLLRGRNVDPAGLFDGSRHGPAPLAERGAPPPLGGAARGVRLDVPDWLLPALDEALGPDLPAICAALRERAPTHLRANAARIDRATLRERLAAEGVRTAPHPLSPAALAVDPPRRGLDRLTAFEEGLFEFQDAGSQALVDRLPARTGMRVLDLCAGGGGKALALAARVPGALIDAFDADPARLGDLPSRAEWAGARITVIDDPEGGAPYDLVLCDVPCSGSGAWRRQPEARWRLAPARLRALGEAQRAILARASRLVRPGGTVAYATCSLLRAENDAVVDGAAALGLAEEERWRSTPLDGADGFFLWRGRRAEGGVEP